MSKRAVLTSDTFSSQPPSILLITNHLQCDPKTLKAGLWHAAGAGHIEAVKTYLGLGVRINSCKPGEKALTPLAVAAGRGHLNVVRVLLAAGADVDLIGGDDSYTALHLSVEGDHFDVTETLLAARATVDLSSINARRTTLQLAAEKGQLATVERLFIAGADVHFCPVHARETALQLAAGGGHIAVVERLLAAGADVDSRSDNKLGFTPLMAAVEGGHICVFERLLAAGADVYALTGYTERRLSHLAATKGHLVTKKKFSFEQLYFAFVERLVSIKYSINSNEYLVVRKALNLAAKTDKLVIMQDLLAHWSYRVPLLHVAAWTGCLDATDMLLMSGADVNARGWTRPDKESTALHLAAEEGHYDIVKRLLAAGADVEACARQRYGFVEVVDCRPLHSAAMKGHADIIDQLLAAGADINASMLDDLELHRITALDVAATSGHMELFRQLMAAGAHIDRKEREDIRQMTTASRTLLSDLLHPNNFWGDASGYIPERLNGS